MIPTLHSLALTSPSRRLKFSAAYSGMRSDRTDADVRSSTDRNWG